MVRALGAFAQNSAPVVNMRVLRNPQLSAGLILFVVLGFGLYGGVFVYPIFAQSILRLTPTDTGLALFPGGLATAISAFTAGRLLASKKVKIAPRVIITAGLLMFLCSMIWLGILPPTSGVHDATLALILRGAGLGMLFIPINIAAFSTLKGPEIAQGSALLNLCRQLGGSFGIAILATNLTNQTAINRSLLSQRLVIGANPALADRYQLATRLYQGKGFSGPLASQAAQSGILRSLDLQASAVAFNQSFQLIAIAIVVAAPALFLLKSPKQDAPIAVPDSH